MVSVQVAGAMEERPHHSERIAPHSDGHSNVGETVAKEGSALLPV